jgi:hypothetical protein
LALANFPLPMTKASLIIYAGSVVALYFALVFNNNLLPDPTALMRKSDENATNRLLNHRAN